MFIKRKLAVVILIFLTLFSIEECYHETIFKIVFFNPFYQHNIFRNPPDFTGTFS